MRLLLLSLALLCFTSSASAQARLDHGGLDLRLYMPAVDSKGLLSLNGSDVLNANAISFGLVLDGALGLVPFDGFVDDTRRDAADAQRVDHLVDHLITGTLSASYGIANVASVGLHVPVQVVSGPSVVVPGEYGGEGGGLDYEGLSSIMAHGKVRLLRHDRDGVGVAAILQLEVPTGDGAAFAGSPGLSLAGVVALEWRPVSAIRLVANAGYRASFGEAASLRVGGATEPGNQAATGAMFAPRAETTSVAPGDSLRFGMGAAVRIGSSFELIGEIYGAQHVAALDDPRMLSLEAGGGARVFVERNSYLFVGATAGIGDGVLAPDVRGILGFVFEPSIGDRDGDGLADDTDACPDEPEDFDGFEDQDGCPDPDDDRDGILDVDDSCRLVPEDRDGDADDDGCPESDEGDRDGDRILDQVDQCPDEPEDYDGFQDQDGCPDPDNDVDRILDIDDVCPNDPEDYDGWEDEDGCPDPDNDNDRILDVSDGCPNDPEDYDGTEDGDGCPDPGALYDGGTTIALFEQIQFETDSARIRAESYPLLDQIAAVLEANPQLTLVEIQGHADERGGDAYNIALTRDRAAAVLEGLVQRGTLRSRMRSAGYGERCPAAEGHDEQAWQANRRVEIKVLAIHGEPTGAVIACEAGVELTPR